MSSIKANESTTMELHINTKDLAGGSRYPFELTVKSNSARGKREYSDQESLYWDRWCEVKEKKKFIVEIDRPPQLETGPSSHINLGDVVKAKKKTFSGRIYLKNTGGGKLSLFFEAEGFICKDKEKITGNFISFHPEEVDLKSSDEKDEKSEVCYLDFDLELQELDVNCDYGLKFYIKDKKLSKVLQEISLDFRLVPSSLVARPVFGIDFGTSASKVATIGRDGVELIRIKDKDTFPSLIYLDDMERAIIGYEADEHRGKEGFVKSVKMLLRREEPFMKIKGKDYPVAHLVGEFLQKLFQYVIREEETEQIFGKGIKPQDAELVITIPAEAREKYEEKMSSILKEIGFRHVTISVESTAAAGFYIQDDIELSDQNKLLIFDCGAGTTDISVLKINLQKEEDGTYSRVFRILAEHGMEMGGNNLDEAFYDFVKERLSPEEKKFLREKEKEKDSLRYDTMLEELEKIKIEFSSGQKEKILKIPGVVSELKITSGDFENVIKPLVDDLKMLVNQTLKIANLHHLEIDRVYLVGGSSYVPVIVKELQNIFTARKVEGKDDRLTCVAKGAAISKLGKTRRVLPYCYGFSLEGKATMELVLERGLIYPVKRHRMIPFSIDEKHFYIEFYIHRADSREDLYSGNCTGVKKIKCDIEQVPGCKSLELHFDVDEKGELDCYVIYDPAGTGKRFEAGPL